MAHFFRRGAFALAACLVLAAASAGGTAADIGPLQTNQATLSCNDGHSAVMWVDAATLTSLLGDVAAINSSGTGKSCSLDSSNAAAKSSTTGAKWTVYDYNASGKEIAPRNSPGSGPAQTSGTTTTFPFLDGHYTALLTTTDKSLTGNLSTATLNDDISVGGSATTFMTQDGGGDCVNNTPAAVRFYFVSPSASGSSGGPAGFYTRFWWSNPENLELTSGNQSGTISALMSDPSEWSDWNGQKGDSSPAVLAAFEQAIQKVQTVGLSFGGECFFETGVQAVGTPENFSSDFSES